MVQLLRRQIIILRMQMHSKLDGIESYATADQTASEIVALIADDTIAPSAIDMEDAEEIKLGNRDDLKIYHDGSALKNFG